jgi:hypothetical protein
VHLSSVIASVGQWPAAPYQPNMTKQSTEINLIKMKNEGESTIVSTHPMRTGDELVSKPRLHTLLLRAFLWRCRSALISNGRRSFELDQGPSGARASSVWALDVGCRMSDGDETKDTAPALIGRCLLERRRQGAELKEERRK